MFNKYIFQNKNEENDERIFRFKKNMSHINKNNNLWCLASTNNMDDPFNMNFYASTGTTNKKQIEIKERKILEDPLRRINTLISDLDKCKKEKENLFKSIDVMKGGGGKNIPSSSYPPLPPLSSNEYKRIPSETKSSENPYIGEHEINPNIKTMSPAPAKKQISNRKSSDSLNYVPMPPFNKSDCKNIINDDDSDSDSDSDSIYSEYESESDYSSDNDDNMILYVDNKLDKVTIAINNWYENEKLKKSSQQQTLVKSPTSQTNLNMLSNAINGWYNNEKQNILLLYQQKN